MLPCAICGKDAAGGWVTGYVPAPDSQKMALCPEHDTAINRKTLQKTWYAAMQQQIQTATTVTAYQAARSSLQILTLYFTSGGSLSLPCFGCVQTEHGTLKVSNQNGSTSFFPMQQIKRYDLAALPPALDKKPS